MTFLSLNRYRLDIKIILQSPKIHNRLFGNETSSEDVLERIYKNYYAMLCTQVYVVIRDKSIAEDIVQEVIVEIWKKRDTIEVHQSLEAYLKRACKNRALNHIRAQKIKWEDESSLIDQEDTYISSEEQLFFEEFEQLVCVSIDQLPHKCRLVFSLSRFENMSYAEIADNLGISVKTVENQISKALKVLREKIYKNNY